MPTLALNLKISLILTLTVTLLILLTLQNLTNPKRNSMMIKTRVVKLDLLSYLMIES